MITRPSHTKIASILHDVVKHQFSPERIVSEFCSMLAGDNPKFDETKFREAIVPHTPQSTIFKKFKPITTTVVGGVKYKKKSAKMVAKLKI